MKKTKLCIYGLGGGGKEALSFFFDSMKANDNYSKNDVVFMVDDAFYSKKKLMGIQVIKKSVFNPKNFKVVVAVHDPIKRKKQEILNEKKIQKNFIEKPKRKENRTKEEGKLSRHTQEEPGQVMPVG